VIIGSISLVFYLILFLWFLFALVFG
jgi:hypothetical protein